MRQGTLRSGEVATRAGVNVETLRYYERRGILANPGRRPERPPARLSPSCSSASRIGHSRVDLPRWHAATRASLAVSLASVAWSTRSHRRAGPFVATVLGSAAVVAGRILWSVPSLLYGGVVLLVAASLSNLWLKRPRRSSSFK